jgi:NADH-quinone oxidoreductase subunit L
VWVRRPGTAAAIQARLRPLHGLFVHKWYFDELIDLVVVRPAMWFGMVSTTVVERIVVTGGITGGTVGVVRAGSAAVRRWQTGFLRYYAAAMIVALAGVALYFLVSAS